MTDPAVPAVPTATRATARARLGVLATAAALGLAAAPLQAADTPEPPPPPRAAAAPAANPLAPAQAELKAGRYAAALEALRRVNLNGNADWHNLMGYAMRKQNPPDLAGAQQQYDAALRVNPRHLGALEYAGELALMKKDLPAAEAYLARLQAACGSARCEELDELKDAIARFKSGR